MLFAEQLDQAGQALSVTGILGAVVTVIGATVTAIISARSARDKLVFDADMRELQVRVRDLESDVKDAKESEAREVAGHAECRREVSRLRDKLEQMSDWLVRRGMPKPGTGEHDSLPDVGK